MDATQYLRLFMALGLVLALIGICGLLLRRYGPAAGLTARRKGDRRLGIVEVLTLDARRRLVLVRRDGVEHLLLLGHGEDRVVETGIAPPSATPHDFKAVLGRQDMTDTTP
ncbi:flagellar biosynthetic protein FliO [Niveispirillum fermenti]|uniref:flagellar biosynthetic protein FliO n=1 Tax=Niveispirillum fermenti TaxID=1233113 RepID=UPI003A8B120B